MAMTIGGEEQEGLASTVSAAWTRLSDERSGWLERVKEVRDYVFAPSTVFTEVGSLPWKNKTNIPKLTQIYDNLLAQYMQAIMPNDDWFVFEGITPEDAKRDSMVEYYMKIKLEQSGFRTVLRKLLADWLISGITCAGVEYKEEKITSVSGTELIKYKGSSVFRVSPYDFVFDNTASDISKATFIRRRLLTLGELDSILSSPNKLKYKMSDTSKLIALRQYVRTNEDALKDATLKVDGFTNLKDYFDSDKVELLEYWGDTFNYETGKVKRNQVVYIVDRMFVLVEQDNPMLNQKRPYVITGWRERPDNLYSQSPLELLVGMQYRINHLENAKADIFDLTVHPQVIVYGDNADEFTWKPNGVYYTGTEGKVEILRTDGAALLTNNEITNYMNLMEEAAGAPKQTAGFRTAGEKTAYEVSVLSDGANKMFLEKTKHFEDTFISELLEIFYVLQAENFSLDDIVKVFDEDAEVWELVRVTKEDIIADGMFKPQGAKHFDRRNKLVQEVSQTIQTLAGLPATSPHIDGYGVVKALESLLGLERFGLFNKNQAVRDIVDQQYEQQTYAQEAQAQLPDTVRGAMQQAQATAGLSAQ